ncbi:helix-turn-helix domain-containing protein [Maioricimonas sp. JC845]|uniref:helix-turn-helix domain-containing protein n=1 Tax=Maioricimonas sp. JC845 TaxID=3232138 RepID=UPI00345A26C0
MSDRGNVHRFVRQLEEMIRMQFHVTLSETTRRILEREALRLGVDYCEDFGQLLLVECLTDPPSSDSDVLRLLRRVRQRLYRELKQERERLSKLSGDVAKECDPVDLAALREVVEGLPDDDLVLLFERLSAGSTVQDIAAEMGVSRRTVYRRLKDLRTHIRNHL